MQLSPARNAVSLPSANLCRQPGCSFLNLLDKSQLQVQLHEVRLEISVQLQKRVTASSAKNCTCENCNETSLEANEAPGDGICRQKSACEGHRFSARSLHSGELLLCSDCWYGGLPSSLGGALGRGNPQCPVLQHAFLEDPGWKAIGDPVGFLGAGIDICQATP